MDTIDVLGMNTEVSSSRISLVDKVAGLKILAEL